MVREISKNIFIIGPGGVGKTTCGKLLSDRIGYKFIDLDHEFTKVVGDISEKINTTSYEEYYKLNSDLLFKLLKILTQGNVFILSSGFLTYNNFLTQKHLDAMKNNGVSVLLLPDKSIEKSVDVIVARQLSRGYGLKKEREEQKFKERYPVYKKYGDIKIYSIESPNLIVDKIISQLYLL